MAASDSKGRRQDGSIFPMEMDLSEVQLGSRKIQIGCVRDISEQIYTETLPYQALHDDLTGLPNRVLFGDRVSHAIRAADRSGETLALLVTDLDGETDLAMYDAKRSGSGFALFAAEQEDAPARRLALLSALRHCVERYELVLRYQPKVGLATRRTIGVEALIRWNHPSGRMTDAR